MHILSSMLNIIQTPSPKGHYSESVQGRASECKGTSSPLPPALRGMAGGGPSHKRNGSQFQNAVLITSSLKLWMGGEYFHSENQRGCWKTQLDRPGCFEEASILAFLSRVGEMSSHVHDSE